VALDGTKIHANASRHSALSYEHAGKIEAQLKAEVADLMAKAEAADEADIPDGRPQSAKIILRDQPQTRVRQAASAMSIAVTGFSSAWDSLRCTIFPLAGRADPQRIVRRRPPQRGSRRTCTPPVLGHQVIAAAVG